MKRLLLTFIACTFTIILTASVVYKNIPDTKISSDGTVKLDIDFNSDGTREFVIKLHNGGIIIRTNYIFVDGGGVDVFSFSKGDTISPTHGFVSGGNLNIQSALAGNFPLGEHSYIGVSMRDFPAVGTHTYGWIRIKVDGNENCTVYDYAFEDVHNKYITAGHIGGGYSVGINVVKEPTFTIYPNPVSDVLHIAYGSNENDVMNVNLYSINGALINSFEGSQKEINLSEYRSGQYLVSIRFRNNAVETRRIVVE